MNRFNCDALLKAYDLETPQNINFKIELDMVPEDLPEDQSWKKNISRKRKNNSKLYAKEVIKTKRLAGESFKNIKGKSVMAKFVKSGCTQSCNLKCNSYFSHDQRESMHKSFWNLKSYCRQKDYLSTLISSQQPLYCRRDGIPTRRNVTYQYHLQCDNVRKLVCRKFFLATFDISCKQIYNLMRKLNQNENVSVDGRGRHNKNKTSGETSQYIKMHIESFPALESHYCRKSSNKKYLAANLNIKKMYNLYCEWLREYHPEHKKASQHIYRQIFNNDFNFSFHSPKKDQCLVCSKFNNANAEEKVLLQDSYDFHQKQKNLSRVSKQADKNDSDINNALKVFTFDLQKVLSTPCAEISTLYYSRKFSTYNLTFYDLSTKDGFCYVWNENEGGRGSDEIGSILINFLNSLETFVNVKEVTFYCDCCSGQNRNQYIASLLLHALKNSNLETINIKFLVSGHTQMEVDSMHSAIECSKKGLTVFSPPEWLSIIRNARKDQPYFIKEINHKSFYDLKKLKNDRIEGDFKSNANNKKVEWLKIRWLQFRKSKPNTIYYKQDFEREKFEKIKVSFKEGADEVVPIRKYKKKIKLSENKLNDLLKLCKNGTIPPFYHAFYNNLKSDATARDTLPETDVEDSPDDDY